jgi:hypothetical protein
MESCITSTGKIFLDGAMIELVASSSGLDKPDLLLWNGRKAIVGSRVKHGGCIYEAPELAPRPIPGDAAAFPVWKLRFSTHPICRNHRLVSSPLGFA